MPQDAVIAARSLVKNYGPLRAVDGISFEVRRGECFGLLGPNGAGKSTFIALLYGAARRNGGELSVFGLDPATDSRAIKRRLGVVTQENALDEELTVRQNMLMYAAFQGIPSSEQAERVDALLDYMLLTAKKDADIRALSGGMKRRLVFVRALLGKPEILVLDEPTTGLDPAVRHLLWSKVREVQAQGTTVLVTTHYIHEAEVLCDRVAIMDGGKIVDINTPRELIGKHAPGFVAVYGVEHEAHIDGWMKEIATLQKFRDVSLVYLVAPTLEMLIGLAKREGLQPQLMRPANLEDVFLRITNREHSIDA
jgi:lipooligosaccharide transport system ATP-binding protein